MASRSQGREAVLAALSDVVTVTPHDSQHRQADRYEPATSYSGAQPMPVSEPPRMVPSTNPFESEAPPPPAKSEMAGKFANAFKRQTTEEKEAKRRAKEARMKEEINKSSAKSSRMDIIDRLDLSGINGSSMFHHDSPYDACTPHMNKGKRAPVRAFDPNMNPMTGLPYNQGQGPARSTTSPLAKGSEYDDEKSGASGSRPSLSTNGSVRNGRSATAPMVPSLAMNADASTAELVGDVEGEHSWRNQGYHTQPSHVPDSRHDFSNPNADVWGVSAEPWQDFAQPKQREKGARSSTLSPYAARGSGDRSGISSAASSVFDMEAVMTGRKSSRNEADLAAGSASPFPEPNYNDKLSPNDVAPKRSKSLIKRIKSMKENPNVPSGEDSVELGARRRRGQTHRHSPSTPPMRQDSAHSSSRAAADAAVGASSGSYGRRHGGMERHEEDERLTPQAEAQSGGYFVDSNGGSRQGRSPGAEAGLGRSGSIFNKFKRGQKASKSTEREIYA